MNNVFLVFILLPIVLTGQGVSSEQNELKYYGKDSFRLEGTNIADSLKENRYDRLPASYKDVVREPVWELSKSSTGLSIRFITNSPIIRVKWEVLNDLKMDHMPDTGIKGVDLYFRNKDGWQYLNTGRPQGILNEYTLIENMAVEEREYKIYLPLYDGIKSIEVGIDSNSFIIVPDRNMEKPIVFYGTSITQGGCASRPGMAHTNIISRKLDVDVLNFGFSANGRMEKPIAELISESDAEFYVIECMPNMLSPQKITERTIPLVDIIREKNPNTPIILVDLFKAAFSVLNNKVMEESIELDNALKIEFQKMIDNGYKNIFYVESLNALGSDQEGTVDGVHFTDLGFMRYADFLLDKFEELNLIKQQR
ncbi:MAG: SGNH/GDSL hydrolase family protein [Robiginitalea sp.]|jgi:hypothetical protein